MLFDDLYAVQSIALYGFPTLVFMILFFLALGYIHIRTRNSEEGEIKIIHQYPEGIEERNAPFPLMLILVIAGTVIWGVFYIMAYGLLGVKL